MSTTVTHRHEAEVTTATAATAAVTTTDDVSLDTAELEAIVGLEAQVGTTAAPAVPRLTWAIADDGLWVANYGGYYGGTVDRQGAHFFVADTFGQYVGDYRSLDTAKAKLAERLDVVLPEVLRSAG